MNRKLTTFFLFCILFLTGLAGWWFAAEDPTPGLNGSVQATEGTPDEPNQRDANIRESGRTEPESSSNSEPAPTAKVENAPKLNHWRITGQLKKAFTQKYQPLDDLKLSEIEIELQTILNNEPNAEQYTFFVETDDTGRFMLEIPKDDLPTITGYWRINYEFDIGNQDVGENCDFDDWYLEGDETIDLPSVHNLLSPTVSSDELILGTLELNFQTAAYFEADDEQVIFGNIAHVSGVPMANWCDITLVNLDEYFEDTGEAMICYPNDEKEILTDSNGNFLLLDGWDKGNLTNPSNGRWALYFDEILEFDDDEDGSNAPAMCGNPELKDGAWDFGTLQVSGCLVEVSFEGDIGNLNWYQDISFNSIYNEYCVDITSTRCNFVLPEGRYNWECCPSGYLSNYESLDGQLDVVAGQPNRLVLSVAEDPTFRLRLTLKWPESGPSRGQRDMKCHYENESVNGGFRFTAGEIVLLPADKGILSLTVSAKGYVSQTLDVDPKAPPASVILQAMEYIEVLIHLPKKPDNVKAKHMSVFVLAQTSEHRARNKNWGILKKVNLRDEPQVVSMYFRTTVEYSFCLTGEFSWGFRKMEPQTELVFCNLLAETVNEVTLPEMPEPIWEYELEKEIYGLTIGGKPASISGKYAIRYLDRGKHHSISNGLSNPNYSAKYITGIYDGDEIISAETTPPTNKDKVNYVSFSLPSRVSVTAWQGGEQIHNLEFTASTNFNPYFHTKMRVKDGKGFLWLPEGNATVRAKYNGWTEMVNVDVVKGQVVDVKIQLSSCRVTFTGLNPENNGYRKLFRKHLDDHIEYLEAISAGSQVLLSKGNYSVFSTHGKYNIEFEVTGDVSELSVALPKSTDTEYATGTITIANKAIAREIGDEIDFYFRYKIIVDNPRFDMNPELLTFGGSVKDTPGGYVVSGIPIGVKICLLGDVHLEKEDSTVVKAIKPRVMTLDKEEETITATWIDTTPSDWDEQIVDISSIRGVALEWHHNLPVGRHEFAFYDNDERIILREWITIPDGEEDFKLPENIKKRLAELRSTND